MRKDWLKIPPPWVTALVLLASLVILATLQYRWLDQVRRADRQRREELLVEAGRRFVEDFDREISRAWLCFLPQRHRPVKEWFAVGFERWRETAAFPALLHQVLYLRPVEDGSWRVYRWQAEGEVVELNSVTADLRSLLARLPSVARARGIEQSEPPILADLPALLIPLRDWQRRGPRTRRRSSSSVRPGAGQSGRTQSVGGQSGLVRQTDPSGGYVLVHFDRQVLVEEVLPDLAQRYFGASGEIEYRVAVRGGDDQSDDQWAPASAARQEPLMVRGPNPGAAHRGPVDLRVGLFGFLPAEKMRDLGGQLHLWPNRLGGEGEEVLSRGRPRLEEIRHSFAALARFAQGGEGGRWQLEVTHPSGSLDQAVAGGMRRSLALGLGVLSVLALSVWALDRSARRAQLLAGQQLDFVAGVTHELMTPLAAVRSAGQNLADGVVVEPPQVRRYGSLIEKEGRRLSVMVSEILDLAGMQAGGRQYELRPVRPEKVIEAALLASRPALEQARFEVETEVGSGMARLLPRVQADENGLVRAFENLIGNALKHAREGRWLALRGREVDGGVEFSVEDRGPGIAEADRERIFEPFVRGRKLAGSNVAGVGLGLNLVRRLAEAHHGRIGVENRSGGGAIFRLWLPAATEESGESGGAP